jgi:hypothetical protein
MSDLNLAVIGNSAIAALVDRLARRILATIKALRTGTGFQRPGADRFCAFA